MDLQGSQARTLPKRWLISSFITQRLAGTSRGIGNSADRYDFCSAQVVDDVISEVRTDLDGLFEAEQFVLEYHGYIRAEAAMQWRAPQLIRYAASFAIPHPE